ncbi:hypothetical protein [Mesorhizobium sp. M6A.T.Ce.TU.016.01.1.1]|uniref:hypothetical protein n=1 Tax=Mesorhizobium sp. M6A.T.Ce.TU.016.01.1.1 TaxID=2496783 RepID=UPI000FCB1971|nr:hypothetical protein [Mesorhizobium sp. M6A.T.Ce.TU.016.01.1.1]RUU32396.1 hypothetical protein EOC94_02755 [Mesorhizobium sp. M6A.T.Ce.TU.016.01.1.1]
MRRPATAELDEVDALARQRLRDAYECAAMGGGDITYRSWTPVGARTKKKRRFTLLARDGEPKLVSKSALDADDGKVAGEFDKLTSGSLPPTIEYARPVARTETGFIMTYVPAADLPDALLESGNFAALLERTVDLVAQMHNHGAVRLPDPERRWTVARQYVSEPCTARSEFRAAIEGALLGPTQGDLAPWNLRHDPSTGKISIIDWEDYRPLGIAAMDIINLLVTLGLVVFPEYRERGHDWLYNQVLESEHWYALLLRRLVVRYAERVGTPPRLVIDLLPFHCQWLIARINAEGRDHAPLYYRHFFDRYTKMAPRWVEELADE